MIITIVTAVVIVAMLLPLSRRVYKGLKRRKAATTSRPTVELPTMGGFSNETARNGVSDKALVRIFKLLQRQGVDTGSIRRVTHWHPISILPEMVILSVSLLLILWLSIDFGSYTKTTTRTVVRNHRTHTVEHHEQVGIWWVWVLAAVVVLLTGALIYAIWKSYTILISDNYVAIMEVPPRWMFVLDEDVQAFENESLRDAIVVNKSFISRMFRGWGWATVTVPTYLQREEDEALRGIKTVPEPEAFVSDLRRCIRHRRREAPGLSL